MITKIWMFVVFPSVVSLGFKVLAQDCGDPGDIDNGHFAGSTTFDVGASIICENGFTGGGAATCQVDGDWAPLPTCYPIDCLTPSTPNGAFIGVTVFGGIANVTCNAGYKGDGPAYCLSSGGWDTLPICTPKDCGPPEINNGRLSSDSDTLYNGSATVECNTGYQLQGDGTATCLDNGSWDTLPSCDPKDCGPPTISHGSLKDGYSTLYDGSATVECDAGYTGGGTATCLETGLWATMPPCNPKDCQTVSIQNGNLTGDTVYNGSAEVLCNLGYTGDGPATCLDTGVWDTLPKCTPWVCGDHGDPKGDLSGVDYYGGKATIYCHTGYTGGGAITCQDEGIWDLSQATPCSLVDCGSSDDPKGAISGSSLYGEAPTITCNPGYTGGGPVKCLPDGTWNTSLATLCVLADCGPLISPTNGEINLTATTYGSSATFTCGSLYQMTGSSVLTCDADGSWSSAPPTCEDIDCPALTDPNNGVLSTTAVTVGSSVDVECNTGYSLFGTTPLVCQTGGAWSDVVGVCKIDCPTLTPPTYGTLSTDIAKEGISVIVKCNNGYTMFGEPVLGCLTGATWNTTVADCVRECGSLTDPQNGAVSHPDGTTLNEVATYTCNSGYYLSHTDSRVCQADGSWSNTPAICVIHDCGDLLFPSNGDISYPTGTTFNETAVYSCDIGYDLVGDQSRTCQADGTWDLTDPYCQIRDCGPLSNPVDGSVVTSPATTYLSVATYSCNPGFTMNGTATRTCNASALWDNEAPICEINDCGSLSNPLNGAVSFPGTTYTQNATYTCDPGYKINGETMRTCQANSTWSDVQPTCDIKDCGFIVDPDNGDVTYSNDKTTYQEVATFTCDAGYDLIGVLNRTCMADGLWGESSPHCQIKDCGNLQNPVDGSVNTSAGTTFKETATYSCDAGYTLIGNIQRVCQSDGQWGGNASTCQIKDCGPLFDPSDGLVTVSLTTYGEIANYTCNAGYKVVGAEIRTCLQDGIWSDEDPLCKRKDCGPPPDIDNGVYTTPDGTEYEDAAIYSCNIYYGLFGAATVQCLNTGLWDTPPACSLDCGVPVSIENGNFTPPATTVVGTVVTYTCDVGYEMVRNENITCQNGGIWTQAPGCRLAQKVYNETCLSTVQCVTIRSTCRVDGVGQTRCLCNDTVEIYDSIVDTCLADCGPLPAPIDGSIFLPAVTAEGQTASYSCDHKYALSDLSLAVRKCLATGEWSGSAPTCEIGCSSPVPPLNGYINASDSFKAGRRIYYSCASGFALVGVEERVCVSEDGRTTWSQTDPICSAECPLLSSISHGNVDLSGGHWKGSIATYVCEKDYALVGEAIRKCMSNGNWKGVEPICVIAIFPDVLLAIGSVLIFLVIIDILGIAYCVYTRYIKKKEDEDPAKYAEMSGDMNDVVNTNGSLPNALPSLMAGGAMGASFRKHAKDAGQSGNMYATPELARKSPVLEQARSTLNRPEKIEPFWNEPYKGLGQTEHGFEPVHYQTEEVPYVPIIPSRAPPTSFQQQPFDDQNESKKPLIDLRNVTTDENKPRATNKKTRKPNTEEEISSLDNVTKSVYEDKSSRSYKSREEKRPTTKMEDASVVFKGRMSLPKVPDGVATNFEGERFYTEETRKHLKESVKTYSPTIPTNQTPS